MNFHRNMMNFEKDNELSQGVTLSSYLEQIVNAAQCLSKLKSHWLWMLRLLVSIVKSKMNFHKGSQVARVSFCSVCSLNIFVIVFVFVFLIVFLLVKCFKGNPLVTNMVWINLVPLPCLLTQQHIWDTGQDVAKKHVENTRLNFKKKYLFQKKYWKTKCDQE